MSVFNYPADKYLVYWACIGFLSLWGGVARYILDIKKGGEAWSWHKVILQVTVSGFSGVLGGLLSFETNASLYMTFVSAGLASLMGGWFLNIQARKIH